jgi:hypothetical protein
MLVLYCLADYCHSGTDVMRESGEIRIRCYTKQIINNVYLQTNPVEKDGVSFDNILAELGRIDYLLRQRWRHVQDVHFLPAMRQACLVPATHRRACGVAGTVAARLQGNSGSSSRRTIVRRTIAFRTAIGCCIGIFSPGTGFTWPATGHWHGTRDTRCESVGFAAMAAVAVHCR